MGLAVVLLLLALVFGAVGLLVAGLEWALVVALGLVVAAGLGSWNTHRRTGS